MELYLLGKLFKKMIFNVCSNKFKELRREILILNLLILELVIDIKIIYI